MADKDSKVPGSTAGPWYVDETCIGCGVCVEVAARFFEIDRASGQSRVVRQPATAARAAPLCEARVQCPVDAIGDDGE